MLVHELFDDEIETINKYDQNGNIIYSKKWCIPTRSIEYEYEQKFNIQNKLIYFKSIDCEYEEFYEYDENGNLVFYSYKDFSGYSYKTIFDEDHRKIKDIDNTGKIIKEYFYENNYIIIRNHETGYTEQHIFNNDTININYIFNNIIERSILKYIDGRLIYDNDFKNNHNISYAYDSERNLAYKEDSLFGITLAIYKNNILMRYSYRQNKELSGTNFEYDSKNKLIKLKDIDLSGNICFVIDYENIYEA